MASLINGMAMQNHQFDLQTGECIYLGDYKVTLLEVEGDAVVLEIEGPDGTFQVEPMGDRACRTEQELAVLA